MTSEARPWGNFEILHESEFTKVKKIEVSSGKILSYQSHQRRAEDWIVVKGSGFVIIDDQRFEAGPGNHFRIEPGQKHRIGASEDVEDLTFIEVQTGDYFGEDDIVRFSDEYGRS